MNDVHRVSKRTHRCRIIRRHLHIALISFNALFCSSALHSSLSSQPLFSDSSSFPYHVVFKPFPLLLSGSQTFIDIDGDGIDEIIEISAGNKPNTSYVLSRTIDGTVIDQTNLPKTDDVILCDDLLDVSSDGHKEIIIGTKENDTLFCYTINLYQHPSRYKFPLYTAPNLPPDVNIDLRTVYQTSEGKQYLLGIFTASLSLQPRGLAAFDISSGKRAWTYLIGAWPNFPLIADVNNDGKKEIYLSANAPSNGSIANGIDDFHSYVIALTENGTLLWKKILGNEISMSRVIISDIDMNGNDELLCIFSSANKVFEKSFIAVIDPLTGVILKKKEFVERFANASTIFTLHVNDEKQVLLCMESGILVLLNQNLDIVKELHIADGIDYYKCFDIYGDEDEEILLRTKSSDYLIFNNALEPLARVGNITQVHVIRTARSEKQLVLSNEHSVRLGTLHLKTGVAWYWIQLSLFVLLLASGIGLFTFMLYRLLFFLQLFITLSRHTHNTAIMVVRRNGKVQYVNNFFHHLFEDDTLTDKRYWNNYFVDAAAEKPTYSVEIFHTLTKAFQLTSSSEYGVNIIQNNEPVHLLLKVHPLCFAKVRLGWLVVFMDISTSLKTERALNWTLITQNMAHEMKTPLSTIWFTLERIRQQKDEPTAAGNEEHLMKSIEEEIRRLDRYVKGFMKLSHLNPSNLQETDFNAVLREFLEMYAEKLPHTVVFQNDFSHDLPSVKLDVHLFNIAVTNLLDNAVDSMEGKGTIKLATYVAQNLSTTFVCLSVADTGCGIRQEDYTKIFAPYFSKSENGTGLGLVITKKIVEEHNGTISFTSREGLGTEFTLCFPAVPTGV
ncbi:MAG: hypothetical protein FJ218_08580 [Ignavibacteria bacterium]|nr:hypothetical protein [Ignavibacteria bacterium]